MKRTDRPAENDRKDKRCAFVADEDDDCDKVTSEDWCSGCLFYICETHAQRDAYGEGHDVVEHLSLEEDGDE